jgi:hypothetical protein
VQHDEVTLAALPDERRSSFNGRRVGAFGGLEGGSADAKARERAAREVDAGAGT